MAVAEVAGARLRAETDGDRDASSAAAESFLAAATAAMSANYSLGEIAQAEARGKEAVRGEIGGEALRLVEHSGGRRGKPKLSTTVPSAVRCVSASRCERSRWLPGLRTSRSGRSATASQKIVRLPGRSSIAQTAPTNPSVPEQSDQELVLRR
jgi:hypothetical protein